jgi:hypothetical protein
MPRRKPEIAKVCEHCRRPMKRRPRETHVEFRERRFCSVQCAGRANRKYGRGEEE